MNKAYLIFFSVIFSTFVFSNNCYSAFYMEVSGLPDRYSMVLNTWLVGSNLDKSGLGVSPKTKYESLCNGGRCRLRIDDFSKIQMGDLSVVGDGKVYHVFGSWYLQDGDQLVLKINKLDVRDGQYLRAGSLEFCGQSNGQYAVQYHIDLISRDESRYPRYPMSVSYFTNDIAKMFDYERAVDMNIFVRTVLDDEKSKLENKIYELIAEKSFYTIFDRYFLNGVNILLATGPREDTFKKIDNLIKRFDLLYGEVVRNPPKLITSEYQSFFLNYLDIKMKLNRGTYEDSIFGIIQDQFSGEQQAVLYYLALKRFHRRLSNSQRVYFTAEALKMASDAFVRENLLKINGLVSGQHFPEFALIDVNGNSVTKDSLANKVVLIDFYYTGCGNCTNYFQNKISKAEEHFEGNEDLLFMSVSIDKDKDVWKRSLQLGIYNSQTAWNVYTGGLGSKHPLIESLMIRGYPFSILIDGQGTIVTADPKELGVGSSGVDRLISVIEKTLKKERE